MGQHSSELGHLTGASTEDTSRDLHVHVCPDRGISLWWDEPGLNDSTSR